MDRRDWLATVVGGLFGAVVVGKPVAAKAATKTCVENVVTFTDGTTIKWLSETVDPVDVLQKADGRIITSWKWHHTSWKWHHVFSDVKPAGKWMGIGSLYSDKTKVTSRDQRNCLSRLR